MVFKERTFRGEDAQEFEAQDAATLESRVADFLTSLDNLDATEITVTSKGNTIVLDGFVGSAEEIDAAEGAAGSVEGVDDVVNRLMTGDAGKALSV